MPTPTGAAKALRKDVATPIATSLQGGRPERSDLLFLKLLSMALQLLDPGMERIAQVALKRGDHVLPGQVFEIADTDQSSSIQDGMFQTELDGTVKMPTANHPDSGSSPTRALRVRRGAPRPRGWAGYLARSKEKTHTRMKHHGKPHHTAVSTHHWLPPRP